MRTHENKTLKTSCLINFLHVQAQEKQKKWEERKNREKFEKYKNVDAGYVLGQGDNTGII
jgi:uncharacterized protein (DUF1919 family)